MKAPPVPVEPLLMEEIRRSPVEVGSEYPIIYNSFYTSQVVVCDF